MWACFESLKASICLRSHKSNVIVVASIIRTLYSVHSVFVLLERFNCNIKLKASYWFVHWIEEPLERFVSVLDRLVPFCVIQTRLNWSVTFIHKQEKYIQYLCSCWFSQDSRGGKTWSDSPTPLDPLAGIVSSLAVSFEERSFLLEIGNHFLNSSLSFEPRIFNQKTNNARLWGLNCGKKCVTPRWRQTRKTETSCYRDSEIRSRVSENQKCYKYHFDYLPLSTFSSSFD